MRSLEINWRDGDISVEHIKDKTTAHTVEVHGQLLNVIEADGRSHYGNKPTIIWPQAFMARSQDPLEIYRAQVIAAQLGTKVITVDRPGVRYDPHHKESTSTGQSSIANVLRATTGNLNGLSHTQLMAIDTAVPFSRGEELHLMGYSFGAWSASSMATVLGREPFGSARQPVISGMTLIEATNDQPRSVLALKRALTKDSSTENISRYLVQNELMDAPEALFFDWKSATERSPEGESIHKALDRKQAFSLYVPALGLRKGFSSSLAASAALGTLQNVKVTLARANGSLVARPDAHEHTVGQINGAGRDKATAEHIEITAPNGEAPHTHPFMHSMGNAAVFATNLVATSPDMS